MNEELVIFLGDLVTAPTERHFPGDHQVEIGEMVPWLKVRDAGGRVCAIYAAGHWLHVEYRQL